MTIQADSEESPSVSRTSETDHATAESLTTEFSKLTLLDNSTSSGGATSISTSLSTDVKWARDHPQSQIIGDLTAGVQTRRKSDTSGECLHSCFLSKIEPKKIEEALADPDWITAMQEELNEFERNKV